MTAQIRHVVSVLLGRVHVGPRWCPRCAIRVTSISRRRWLVYRETGRLTCRCGGALLGPTLGVTPNDSNGGPR